jgi:hypothetical protein
MTNKISNNVLLEMKVQESIYRPEQALRAAGD